MNVEKQQRKLTAFEMIISKPPSFSIDSFTVRMQSASMPMSCSGLLADIRFNVFDL